MHGDALKQIVAIARDADLSIDHIKTALSARQPKAEKSIRVPRKKKTPTQGLEHAVHALNVKQ